MGECSVVGQTGARAEPCSSLGIVSADKWSWVGEVDAGKPCYLPPFLQFSQQMGAPVPPSRAENDLCKERFLPSCSHSFVPQMSTGTKDVGVQQQVRRQGSLQTYKEP